MDPRSNPLQDPLFTLKRYPAGGIPGQSRSLAGLLLCLQSLPVLRLLPGGPALHPPLPAAAQAHSQADAAQWGSRHPLAGGGPSGPEDGGNLVNRNRSECPGRPSKGKAIFASGFFLFIFVLFFPSLFGP